MRKAAIIQSSFIPWKGYFDIIHEADVFVFLDDVQYTKDDWRNRNRVKTPGGSKWLSVPVRGDMEHNIFETTIDYAQDWRARHKKMIHHSYAAAEYYGSYRDDILRIFDLKCDTISELNISATRLICRLLGIDTETVSSVGMGTEGSKDDKLIQICRRMGADHYLSGPSAQNYIVTGKFRTAGIALEYKDYSGYPEYRQLWGGFEHYLSIIDTIFNCGERAPYYIWGWRADKRGEAGQS